MIRALAYAKVNLALQVGARRGDGFHELITLFQTIDLCDTIELEDADSLALAVAGDAPEGADNLVWRAAELLAATAGRRPGAAVRIVKRIPAGGGLGGGSSDAATALVALDRLWRTRAPLEDLYRLALELGSDVPFFLLGGTALGLGRGEKLLAVSEPPTLPVLLVLPDLAVSTARAYAAFDAQGSASREVPPCDWDFTRLWTWEGGAFARLGNDLEPAVFELEPKLGVLKARLAAAGAEHALLSGSGSSLFGVFRSPALARSAQAALAGGGVKVELSETVSRERFRRRIETVS